MIVGLCRFTPGPDDQVDFESLMIMCDFERYKTCSGQKRVDNIVFVHPPPVSCATHVKNV